MRRDLVAWATLGALQVALWANGAPAFGAGPDGETDKTHLSGYVHTDWVAFRRSSQDEVTEGVTPQNEDRFLLRRARLRAERDLGLFQGVFELDANTISGPQVRPINAEVSLKWPKTKPAVRVPWGVGDSAAWFMVTAGLFRTPFGFEVQESERERPWLERATVSQELFPQSFDLGVRLSGGYSFVRYQIGIMNGEPIGTRTFAGRDPNQSKDLVFRVGGATEVSPGIRFEAGVSGLTGRGTSVGRLATKDIIQWQDSNDDGVVDTGEVHILAGSPGAPSQGFRRFAVGADARVSAELPVLGEFAVRAEIVRAQNLDRGLYRSDPIAATRDLRQLGYYVGVSQEMTRFALVSIRYDRYNPDADAREQQPFAIVPRDPSMSTWAFAVSARARAARLVAEYDHRTNALGRDASGAPTNLLDHSLTLRAEVRF